MAGTEAVKVFLISLFGNILYWLGIIILFAIPVVLIGAIVWYFTYNIKIQIYETIGKSGTLRLSKTTSAKIKQDKGVNKLKILWLKELQTPPGPDSYSFEGGKRILKLIKVNDSFVPFTLTFENKMLSLAIDDPDKRFWSIFSMKALVDKYTKEGWWEKYGYIVVLLIGLVALGVMHYMSIKSINLNYARAHDTEAKIAEKLVQLAEILGEKITKAP